MPAPPARSTPTSSSASEHGFNASTFTARVVTSTRSDIASAVAAAIGTMKGPLHGGAPSEVVDQLSQVGSADHAEAWVRDALDRGERLMGFGHRVYRAYDPRAAALRKVAEGMPSTGPDWLQLAIEVEDVALRVLAEKHPERAAQDERRVLRRARAHGRRPDARTSSRRPSRWPATPAGPRTSSSRPPTTGSSARTSTTSARPSATSRRRTPRGAPSSDRPPIARGTRLTSAAIRAGSSNQGMWPAPSISSQLRRSAGPS